MFNAMMQIFQMSSAAYQKIQKKRSEIQIVQTYETTVNMAEQFNETCAKQDRIGDFIFLSADPSLFSDGQTARFTHFKQKAELYLIEECPNIRPIIFRPGKVFLNTFFEKTIENLPLRKRYSSMDSVTAAIVDEVVQIYGDERPANIEPLLINLSDFKQRVKKA